MRVFSRPGLYLLATAGAGFAALWMASYREWLSFGDPAIVTGYCLFALLLALALFAGRKRVSMIPLGRASVWLSFHVVGGLLAVALFWLHSGTVWPSGVYEAVLTCLLYLVVLSGIVGFILQLACPSRLTRGGGEIIYERIPGEIARMKEEAEALILTCMEETGSDTLARHYDEALNWYFQKPRFFLSHALGGMQAQHWLSNHGKSVGRYLNEMERGYHEQLQTLAGIKCGVDAQYSLQSLMKWWLFIHIPPSAALIVVAVWHLILVNLYAV